MRQKTSKKKKLYNAAAYELFHNGLYRPKIIPNKKKALKLKRKKVDIREYQPFLFLISACNMPKYDICLS
jgi:hypothetical protein